MKGTPTMSVPQYSIPSWKIPETKFQSIVLSLYKLKYFPNTCKYIKSELEEIENRIIPFELISQPNKQFQLKVEKYPFPKEWVAFCLKWTISKIDQGRPIPMKGLVSLIKNRDSMIQWLEKNGYYVFYPEKDYSMPDYMLERIAREKAEQSLDEQYSSWAKNLPI
jgi:hypothetical protein